MKTPASVLFLLLPASVSSGQALWTGPAGGGMISVQEAVVAQAGHGAFGIMQDNFDRDPLGLDIDEFRVAGRIGVGKSTELFGWYYFSRAVVVPGPTPVPAPPLDIIVMPGSPDPRPPYRTMYWPLPYLARHSAASVGEMVPGDLTIGAKTAITVQRGWTPAIAVTVDLIAPVTDKTGRLERGSGDGELSIAAHMAATWRFGRWSTSANLGFIDLASLSRTDRIITTTGERLWSIDRPTLVRMAVGTRYRLYKNVSLSMEVFQLSPVGHRTPVIDESGATDLLVGVQMPWRRLTLTAAYRQHMWPPKTGRPIETGSLAGAVDLGDVPPAERDRYLAAIGAPRPENLNSNIVVVGSPERELPAGAKFVASYYRTSTTGNGGTVFSISYRF